MGSFNKKIWIGLVVMALLSPVGLLLPQIFKAGKPWGEWSTAEIANDKGYVPKGMQKDANLYSSPIHDYNLGKEEDHMWKRSGSYIISGIIGLGAIAAITLASTKLYRKE